MLTRLLAQGGAVRLPALLVGLAVGASSAIAAAAPVVLDFNSLSDGNGNSAVQSYINGQLGAGGFGSVTVTGARVERNYTGDDFVTGPRVGSGITPLTLGSSDFGNFHQGSWDSFIVNNATTNGGDRITMNFTQPIYSVSFDFEIFPNSNVPDGTNTSRPFPDFTFDAYAADGTLVEHYFVTSVLPGTGGILPNSPMHPHAGLPELAPQFIGTASFLFPNGVTQLVFIDWPELIGVDNLTLGFAPTPPVHMPEPTTLVVWSLLCCAGACQFIRNRAAARRA